MMIIAVPTAIHYHMNTVWGGYYVYSTLANIMGDLPWSSCDHEFNTPRTLSKKNLIEFKFVQVTRYHSSAPI